ncbi:MAG: DUF2127 domain-containing protein [Desulfobacterales bacterium]
MKKGRVVHIVFIISIIAKGIDGVLEIAGGILLFFISPAQISRIMRFLTQHELSEDKHDVIARYLLNTAHHLSARAELFASIYLLWHGAVKVALVAALLLKQRWAYPAAIVAFLLFIAYQLYRYSHTHAFALIVLSAVDVFVIIMTWLEYKRLRASHFFQ